MKIVCCFLAAYMVNRYLNLMNVCSAHKISIFSDWPELQSKTKTCPSKILCEESEVRASHEGICHNIPTTTWPNPQQYQKLGKWNLPLTTCHKVQIRPPGFCFESLSHFVTISKCLTSPVTALAGSHLPLCYSAPAPWSFLITSTYTYH